MREEIMAIMTKVNKKGKYSQYLAHEKRDDMYSHVNLDHGDGISTPAYNDFNTPVYNQRLMMSEKNEAPITSIQTADYESVPLAKHQSTDR